MKNNYSLLIIILISTVFSPLTAQDHPGVSYGPEDRQFVDIYLGESIDPTPVYFDAHGNGGTTNMPNAIIEDLTAEGISIVAWESLTSVNTQAEVETGWADAELMFAWVKDNADTYNFDTTNFIIGGSSRGSILSWKYSHRNDPNIRGLYMYNALPDGVWQDPSWWHAPDEVKITSPEIFFVYLYEPGTENSHDPERGITIMDKYDELGIGDRDTMVHSLNTTGNTDKYQFLVDFALSVLTKNPLPVELVNFTGNIIDDAFLLQWLTSSETNNQKFEIEESLDGRYFYKIGEVNGNGTVSDQQAYSFKVEKSQNGVYYYRLKQVDFNGLSTYSNVISILFDKENEYIGELYPNPNQSGIFNLNYSNSSNTNLGITVLDISGKLIIKQTHQISGETNHLSLNFSTLNSGMYVVKINNNGNLSYQKIIIE